MRTANTYTDSGGHARTENALSASLSEGYKNRCGQPRTARLPFHGGNTGSIPVGRANAIKHLAFVATFGWIASPIFLQLVNRCPKPQRASSVLCGALAVDWNRIRHQRSLEMRCGGWPEPSPTFTRMGHATGILRSLPSRSWRRTAPSNSSVIPTRWCTSSNCVCAQGSGMEGGLQPYPRDAAVGARCAGSTAGSSRAGGG